MSAEWRTVLVERRAIHFETPAIPENETFRRNRSMLMAEQWPQKQLDNSTLAQSYVAVCGIATPKIDRPVIIRRNSTVPRREKRWELSCEKLARSSPGIFITFYRRCAKWFYIPPRNDIINSFSSPFTDTHEPCVGNVL